jgi:hypothetical protein
MSRFHSGALVVAVLVLCGNSVAAQSVSPQLALFNDPVSIEASPRPLVLGVTTLDEARKLFPDAPTHKGPLSYPGNPSRFPPKKPGTEPIGMRPIPSFGFFLGKGRAILFFDDHQRLVSVSQGFFNYLDPETGRSVVDRPEWAATPVSRNAFRAHYPRSTGQWFDPIHYLIESPLERCLAVSAWFDQQNGIDRLFDLSYSYTCATQPLGVQ